MARTPYRAIPPVGDDLAQIKATVDALHENVEMLLGLRGQRGGSSQTFVRKDGQPTPSGVRDGDLLASKAGGTWSFKVWVNGQWT